MPKIRVLDQDIANKIAAGEVVERPGSVIKELVENALDAGAKHITVEIKNGGITYMRVTDDGCGMNCEDARNCFLRHATSKIKEISDLYAIETLGFRGEALAAISAVSKIELITAEQGIGTRLILEGGKEISCEETGAPQGTTVIVRELFFNTPARMKFLKSDRSESGYIAALMDRLALSNPHVAFKLIQDGKSTLATDGGGKLLDVIYAVLGKDITKGMLQADSTVQQVRVYGYVGEPTVTKNNRNYQLCYINGRLVRSQTVFAAIDQAYRNDLFHGRHAVCVLKINLPYGLVDVNVHPSKMEVKFSNEKLIFEAVYYAIKNALNKQTLQKVETEMPRREKVAPLPVQPIKAASSIKKEAPEVQVFQAPLNLNPQKADVSQEAETQRAKQDLPEEEPIITLSSKNAFSPVRGQMLHERAVEFREEPVKIQKQEPLETPAVPTVELKEETKSEISIDFIGEIFKSYVVVERGDEVYLIDKHAAHERMIFERLLKEVERGEGESQQMLVPEPIRLSPEELAFAMEHREEFFKIGFEIDAFGERQIALRSRPVCITNEAASDAFSEILNDWIRGGKTDRTSRENRALKTVACKAAIKAGNINDSRELKALVLKLIEEDEIHQCPHGRPIALTYNKKDIEKAFKRI
jgi:DNA mismatch repair protein MutL